jgi:hypothetical protein
MENNHILFLRIKSKKKINNEVKANFWELLERLYALLHRKFQIYYFPILSIEFNKLHNIKIIYRLRYILVPASLSAFHYFLNHH